MIELFLTPISLYGETAYTWGAGISLFALVGFILFYTLSVAVIGPIMGEGALFLSIFVSLVFLLLIQFGIQRQYNVFADEIQAKAFIASNLRAHGELEESLTVKPDQPLSLADVKSLVNTKNIIALKAVVGAFENGSDDILKDKTKADAWAKKTINVVIDSKADQHPVKLIDAYQEHLTKHQIATYLQKVDKNCQTAQDIYESTSTVRSIGEKWADSFSKEKCIPLYNKFN